MDSIVVSYARAWERNLKLPNKKLKFSKFGK
jgi:hypothetical protein